LPASLQGIVVEPLIDTLRVRSLRDGVELTSADGLALSPPAEGGTADIRPAAMTEVERLLDVQDWTDGPASSFAARRQALERAAIDSVGAERERNRLRLAQFLLGQRFAAEALGVLTLAAEERPPASPRNRSSCCFAAQLGCCSGVVRKPATIFPAPRRAVSRRLNCGRPQRRQPQVSRPVTCRVWRNGRRSSPATRPVCGSRCFCR
jgi:hypothetical protein